MGRGKRAASGSGARQGLTAQPAAGYPSGAPSAPTPSRPKRLGKAVYKSPPWPEADWHSEDFVTDHRVDDAAELAATLATLGVSSWADLSDGRVTAIVSGEQLDNAHGTRPVRIHDKDGNLEWSQQEFSVYLLKSGVPVAELNLADLCAWASAPERGQGHQLAGPLLLDQDSLAAFADERKMSWHEPDEQEISGRIQGKRLERSDSGLRLDLCRMEWNERKGDYDPGDLLASVYLVDLLAWASGFASPQPRQETRRGRVSPLGA